MMKAVIDMHSILRDLLMDQKGGITFHCFDAWHIGYILVFVSLAVWGAWYLRNKSAEKRSKVIGGFVTAAFVLYMADFFCMPLAYGEINVEKLPFHVCTTMCIMCFISRHNKALEKYKLQFAVLGFVSNLVYLLYPAGVMWYEVHPLSYRAVQTLAFHGVMMGYGALVLIYESDGFVWKKCYRDLALVIIMTVWALLGNTMYNTAAKMYNWFFVIQDPFAMFPIETSVYIMPGLNIVLFFGAEMLVYWVFRSLMRKKDRAIKKG